MQGTSTARAPGSPQFSGDSLIRMDEPLQKLDPHLYQVRHNSHLRFSQFEGEPPQCPLGNLTEGALVLAITQLAQNRSQPHQAAWWCSVGLGARRKAVCTVPRRNNSLVSICSFSARRSSAPALRLLSAHCGPCCAASSSALGSGASTCWAVTSWT